MSTDEREGVTLSESCCEIKEVTVNKDLEASGLTGHSTD